MSRPNSVNIALSLLFVALASGFINTFSLWQTSINELGVSTTLLAVILPTVVYIALLLLVSRRHNWARIILVLLLILSIPGYIMTIIGPAPTLNKMVQAFQLTMNTVSAVILLSKTSRVWFKNNKKPNNACS